MRVRAELRADELTKIELRAARDRRAALEPLCWHTVYLRMAFLRRSTTRWAGLVSLALLGLVSCGGQSSYDLYLAAMKAHGDAERGSCRLVFDRAEQAHIINSSRVASCLQDVREVEEMYEKAGAHGYTGKELDRAKLKLRTEIERLESMLRTIQMMERESQLERGKLP